MSDLRVKCTKFDFRWGSAHDPAGGFTALHRTPLRGPTSNGKAGKGGRREKGKGKKKEEEGKRRGSKGGEKREGEGQAPKYFGLEPSLAAPSE